MYTKNEIIKKIYNLKRSAFGSVVIKGCFRGFDYKLLLLTADCAEDRHIIDLLAKWRQENETAFYAQFKVTFERTYKWFKERLADAPDRLLFIIEIENEYVGHVGLFRFDFERNICEIDNIVRGEKKLPGLMEDAVSNLMKWGKAILGLQGYSLQVLSTSDRAIKLYKKLGFIEKGSTPMIRHIVPDGAEWKDAPKNYTGETARYNIRMENMS